MKHVYKLLGVFSFLSVSTLHAQVLIDEDFSTASGVTPPVNWTNNEIEVGSGMWSFDNPGGRVADLPIDAPFAVFDSDNLGYDELFEEAALESPLFDVSALTGFVFLSFDHFFYDDMIGAEGFVEVWDGSAWVEVLHITNDTDGTEHELVEITNELNGASDAQVRFRWTGDYSWWWIVDNVKVEHTSCYPIVNLNIIGETPTSLDISWIAGSTESSWNIEWGMPGFTPGAGEEIGSDVSSAENYSISGLTPATDYDIYIQADCQGAEGASIWIPVSGTTLCAPIATLPWYEDFEGITSPGYDVYATCWETSYGNWFSDYDGSFETGAPAHSGSNYMAIWAWNDDTLWTPEFELTAGTNYELKFFYATDGMWDGWSASTVISGADTLIEGGIFIQQEDIVEDYQQHFVCFTPTTDGTYRFGIQAASNWNPVYLVLDDFSLIERGTSAGDDGSATVCQTSGLVDLEGVANIIDADGTWNFTPNPSTIENGNMFNPAFVPDGVVEVTYITNGCLEDTVSAIITIKEPSSAGTDGILTVCKNEPVNLLAGLSGNVDLGGDWYDPSNMLMASSQIMAPSIPGSYGYDYIAGNGVCPDDTANVVITVNPNCNYLSVEEELFNGLSLYPNPSEGIVFIASNATQAFDYIVTDAEGRIVMTANNGIQAGQTTEINLDKAEAGVYFITVSDSQSKKVFRVVIQ